MSNYFTYESKKSYEDYVTLNYLTFNPLHSNKFNSYLKNDDDDKLVLSAEPTELIYYKTICPTVVTKLPPTLMPTLMPSPTFTPRQLNYTCVCQTESSENEKKIIILIVATSLTSFSCVLLILFIIWYRVFFKRKLMNKHQNNRLFFEKFGVDLSDLNNI
jgi:hypothetical protein